MEYSNRANLPPQIVRALVKDRYTDITEKKSDYSISQLIAPIQQVILKQRYPEKMIVPDVMDMYWAFKGSVAHQVLEDSWHESMGTKVEERLYTTVKDMVISGKPDCYGNNEIVDFKFTKVYKIMKGDFFDWEIQLNMYAELLRRNGHKVNKLTIWAGLDDWKKHEAYKKGYPKEPIVSIDLPLWNPMQCVSWLNDAVSCLLDAEGGYDEETLSNIYPCSSRDMWQEVKDICIMKDGAQRATKTFEAWEEAEQYFLDKKYGKEYKIITRMSERRRCASFCPAAAICSQNQRLNKEEGKDNNESQQSSEECLF